MESADLQKNIAQSSTKRKTPSETQTSRRTRPKANTGRSPDGDFTLQSSDGMKFPVHSVILPLASPVFASMFELATPAQGEVLNLEETGEMVGLMLQFIYPKESPIISSFEVLDMALRVADKYGLDGMHQQLRQKLLSSGSPVSAYADPLNAFSIASSHGLKEEMHLARSQAHKNCDFTKASDLLKLAQIAPDSRRWIALIGLPNVMDKAISDVLFNFQKKPMLITDMSFLCKRCKDYLDSPGDHYNPPEWQARWAHVIAAELKKRPIKDWGPCFDRDFLHEAVGRHVQTPLRSLLGPCDCLKKIARVDQAHFITWALNVQMSILERLAGLDDLERLIK